MITLLNGEHWGKEELIAQMYDDEFYYKHLGKHALSSSSLKMILKSPKTYRNVTKYGDPNSNSPALSAGKLAHWMLLEPHKIDTLHFVDASTKNTNKYKDAKEKYGEVFLTSEKKSAERLTDAVLRNEGALRLLTNSEFEIPEIDMLEGLPFRGKADIIQGDTIIDYKTSAELSSFKWSADKYGYEYPEMSISLDEKPTKEKIEEIKKYMLSITKYFPIYGEDEKLFINLYNRGESQWIYLEINDMIYIQ